MTELTKNIIMSSTDHADTLIRVCYFTISKMSNVERNWHSVERKSDLHELKSVATMVKGKNSEIVSHLVVLGVCVMHNFPFLL